jgi:hypothetical protein
MKYIVSRIAHDTKIEFLQDLFTMAEVDSLPWAETMMDFVY